MRSLALLFLCSLTTGAYAQQPLAKFRTVHVKQVTQEGAELVAIALDLAGTDLAETYEVPGQFVQLRTTADEKPSMFALAAGPDGGPTWQLLVKVGSPIPDKLAAMKPGDAVEVTPAQGSGFPVAEHKGQDWVILAMGSGVSAGRALVDYALAHRADYGRITLIDGGKTQHHLAYRGLVDGWARGGATVLDVLSNPEPGWTGATGWVQDQLTRPMLTEHATAVFAVGSKEMVAGITAKLAALGLSDTKVLLNF